MTGVDKIAGAIEQGFKFLGQVLSGSEKRRMRKAIEISEQFIRRYEKLYSEDQRDKTLQKYIHQFFKVNN